MFVMTAKLSKTKLIAAGAVLIAAIVLIVLLASGGGGEPADASPIGNTNDDRVAYLATFGWSVNAEPVETQKVRIPDGTENKVFARYNDLQKSQGFDLTEFAGKEVMRYVYEILNYPDASEPVYASVLIYEGRVIGGDVTDTAPDGVIHGFSMPNHTPSESTPESSVSESTTEGTSEAVSESVQTDVTEPTEKDTVTAPSESKE